jgi:hypothetical protein
MTSSDEEEDRVAAAPPEVEAPPEPEAKKETDAEAAARRKSDLGALIAGHVAEVAVAHATFPTRLVSDRGRGAGAGRRRFTAMPTDERQRYNAKLGVVGALNVKYHDAVRAACERHRAEDPVHEAQRVAGRAALRAADAIREEQRR